MNADDGFAVIGLLAIVALLSAVLVVMLGAPLWLALALMFVIGFVGVPIVIVAIRGSLL